MELPLTHSSSSSVAPLECCVCQRFHAAECKAPLPSITEAATVAVLGCFLHHLTAEKLDVE